MAKIIVIGGGVAGLSAAYHCAPKHEVILLEARDRLGGRVHGSQGATYWEGFNESLFYQQYLKDNTTVLSLSDAEAFSPNGKDLAAFSHYAAAQHKCATLPIGTCFRDWIDKNSLGGWEQKWLEYQLKHFNTPLNRQGFPVMDYPTDNQQEEGWHDAQANFCFVNDYSQVITKMENACKDAGVRLYTAQPVIKIAQNKHGVWVKTIAQEYRADKVISTIPVGVLKTRGKTIFADALSAEKYQAIQTLGIHQGTRITLTYANPFWQNPTKSPYIFIHKPDREGLIEFRNVYARQAKAILQTDSYTKADVRDAISDLKHCYPHAPDPLQVDVYDWGSDPFAQGTYPYRTLAMTEALQQALIRPEGHIYFASSDICRRGFSVHNAYASGRRAGMAVL